MALYSAQFSDSVTVSVLGYSFFCETQNTFRPVYLHVYIFIPLIIYVPDADTDLCCSDVTPHKSMMTVMMRWRLYDLMILLPQP